MVAANPFAAEEATWAESDTQREAEWGSVVLGGKRIPVEEPIRYVNLARFQGRITVGATNRDSDDLLSTWSQASWIGGGQVADLNEGSDTERFWDSTLDTEHPGQLALRTSTSVHAGPNSDGAAPVGDYQDVFWAAFGTELRAWDTLTTDWTGGATLPAAPVGKGLVYDDVLWIPFGADGLGQWDGTTLTTDATITAIDLVEWDDKLLALTVAGQLQIYDGTAWLDPVADADKLRALRLHGQRQPRHLVVFHNNQGEPAVYLVTDSDVWAYDPLVPKLVRTGLNFPRHPDQGRGAAVWRDTDLYVAVGIGVHGYTGAVVSAVGLDDRNGLRAELRGLIVDLEPTYNGLMALTQGASQSAASAGFALEETTVYDAPPTFPVRETVSALWRYTGIGWHKVWESADAAGVPTWCQISQAAGEYQLWWGYAGRMYRHPLRRGFHTPQQGAAAGIDTFTSSGWLLTGRFDADMTGFDKLASHLDVRTHEQHIGQVEVEYHTDRRDWTALGTVSAAGTRTRLWFNPNGDTFAEGDAWEWLEFRYRFVRTGAVTTTPIVDSFVLKFIKVPLQTKSWQLTVPIRFNEQWQGIGPKELKDHLDALTTASAFTTFTVGDETFRVYVAQAQGDDHTGHDRRGNRLISVLQVGETEAA